MPDSEPAPLHTSIGASEHDRILLRGHDLVDEVMGRQSFSHTVFLMISGRAPEPREERLLDACLVSLMDHGLTFSAMIARANYATAPEAIQGAVAAGLLGVGSVVAGSMEGCGQVLDQLGREVAGGRDAQEAVRELVAARRAQKRPVPGFGHRTHTFRDPRAGRLLELAEENGMGGSYVRLLRLLGTEIEHQAGRTIPLNVTGSLAAVLMEMGFEWWILRGFALISRCAGLVAHVREERMDPIVPEFRRILNEGGRGGPA